MIIGSSKNNRENYPRKCFSTQEKETRFKFNPWLSANRPSNTWAMNIICMFTRHESEAQSLSPHYNKKIGKHFFPSLQFPSLLLHFHLPDGGCALSKPHLCWDNLLEYPDFPSLICLKEINGHYCGQIHPKPELSLFGIPTNRAKRDSAKSNN